MDGDQFHQYQQNEQSLLIATEFTEHNDNTTYDVGNPCLGLGQAQRSDPNPPLLINNDSTNIKKRYQSYQPDIIFYGATRSDCQFHGVRNV